MQIQLLPNKDTIHAVTAPPTATYPLDGVSLPAVAYSFMKLRSAYSGNSCRLKRASDGNERDFGFGNFSGGYEFVDVSGIATWAGASAWTVVKMYNQAETSGTTNPLHQKTLSDQPDGNISGINSLPCFTYDSNDHIPTTNTVDLTGNEMNLISVCKRNGGPYNVYHTMFTFGDTVSSIGPQYILVYHLSTGNWRAVHDGATGNWSIPGSSNTNWHCYSLYYNRPGSSLRVWEDGVLQVNFATSPVLGNNKFILGEYLGRNFNGSQEAFIVWDTAINQSDLLSVESLIRTAYGI